MSHGDYGEYIMTDDSVLLELIASAAYPFWLLKLLENLEIYPISFSKYGTVYTQNNIHKWRDYV